MNLNCKNCGAKIEAEHVNLDRLIAKCSACDAVFSFADEFEYAPTPEKAYKKFNVQQPKGMHLEHTGFDLKITRRWFTPMAIFLTFFAVFWNGFIVFWNYQALSMGAWFMSLFSLIHVGVGVFLIYWVLTSYLNRTEIIANMEEVSIQHKPLPWPGNKTLYASNIDQLYCKRKILRGNKSTTVTYEVYAVSDANTSQILVKGLPESEQALFIEQELERYLGIRDRPMKGEL